MVPKTVRIPFATPTTTITDAGVSGTVRVTLCVHYNDAYPDALPDLSLKHDDPHITETDSEDLLTDLRRVVGLHSRLPKNLDISPRVCREKRT